MYICIFGTFYVFLFVQICASSRKHISHLYSCLILVHNIGV